MLNNPLLNSTWLPNFAAIRPEHIEPAISGLIEQNYQDLEIVLQNPPTHADILLQKLEDMGVRLENVWNIVSHLHSVLNTEDFRNPYEKALEKITEYSTKIGQNHKLYQLLLNIYEGQNFKNLSIPQQKIIKDHLLNFKLSGVTLPEQKKKEFLDIQQKLSALKNKFENNLVDSTDTWEFLIKDEKMLAGIPELTIKMAKEKAEKKNLTGHLLTLDFPTYYAIITYAENRALRERIYYAFVTRASEIFPSGPQWDNSQIMRDILENRYLEARLLEFQNFAEFSLALKMANKPEEVMTFLNKLAEKSYPVAKKEFSELEEFANKTLKLDKLSAWDVAFTSEKLRQEKFSISDEILRPYFPEQKVLSGLFEIIHKLFGIRFIEKQEKNIWHNAVRYFELRDEQNTLIGGIYLDLHARPQKRPGAWMDSARSRHRFDTNDLQLPIAYVVCNFMPGALPHGALLNHDDVQTLFHEFGHALHHLLTEQELLSVSGINGVPWDGVEFPSQFLENFCWQTETLAMISQHIETGETLPQKLRDQLIAAKNFQSGMAMMRQLEFSIFDFRLHWQYSPHQKKWIEHVLEETRKKVTVVPVPEFNRFANSFSHIFAGGYAAGYYSYKWAEVLAADAFSRFHGPSVLDPDLGLEFRKKVLAQGGSRDFLEVFVDFMGRKPDVDALLKDNGIIC